MNAAHVVSARRRTRVRGPLEASGLGLRLVAIGLVALTGWIHLHLWMHGYRVIPTIGPLFLAAAIGGFAIATALLVWPSRLFGLAGLGLAVGTFAGLIVSVNVGLFGFIDSLSAPFATESAVIELGATLSIICWMVLDSMAESRHRSRGGC
jgi:hypothetical protein